MAPLTSLKRSRLLQLGANGVLDLLELSFRVNVAIAALKRAGTKGKQSFL